MDGSRFDGLTRLFAAESTRRQAMHGVAGGAFAGLLSHLGFEEAGAACVKPGKKGCQGPKNKKCCQGATCKGGTKTKTGKCGCKGSLTKCGTKCVNIQTNTQHCGACSNSCAAGQSCQAGTCVGGGGGCTPDCAGGQTCQGGGTCACPAGTENSCDSAVGGECYCCPGGQFHCGGGACHECCIGADCGGGGRFCGQGNTCRCPNRQEDCNGICKTCCTTEHCVSNGSEDYICHDNLFCACQNAGEGCSKADLSGYYCPDFQSDELNCGQCGRNCQGWNCIGGVCTPP